MTNKEAGDQLENLRAHCSNMLRHTFTDGEDIWGKDLEALDLAIKALDQEPCEDAISRDELLKAIDTWDKFGCDADTKLVPYQDYYIPYIHYDDVVKCIKGMPSVTPKPKTGYWIKEEKEFIVPSRLRPIKETVSICSNCNGHYIGINEDFKYCPYCGAKMTESEE